jgi:hypothetical protein
MAIRRTVPAIAAALVSYEVIVHLTIAYLRPHYAALVVGQQVSGDVNPFWQYQVIQVAWLTLVTVITASVLLICPKRYRANAWKRAGRPPEIGK